jgi:rubrerythrin
MRGGIDAWNGLISKAEIDQGMYLIEGSESPEEVISLAHGLEEGAYRFYRALCSDSSGSQMENLFEELSQAEMRHKEKLWEKYETLTGGRVTREVFESEISIKTMEGGKTAHQVLAQHPDSIQDPREALQLAMSLETDSLDLYLRMAQKSQKEETSAIFYTLGNEEKKHLRRLGELFRKRLKE